MSSPLLLLAPPSAALDGANDSPAAAWRAGGIVRCFEGGHRGFVSFRFEDLFEDRGAGNKREGVSRLKMTAQMRVRTS